MSKIKWLAKAILAGVISIFLLSVFNFIYSFSGIHIDNPTNATDYTWEPGQFKTTMTEGFAWLTMDSHGFNNEDGLSEKNIDILLMGSSHMEAVNVPADANTGALLNQYLPDLTTYNIGTSGHTIYRCVDNLASAYQTYTPAKYIVIETDSVMLDINSMNEVVSQTAAKIPSYDSGILYHLQKIPAIKWIYKQVTDWTSKSDQTAAANYPDVVPSSTQVSDEYLQSLEHFLQTITNSLDGTGCQAIIFYHPVTRLNKQGNLVTETDNGYLEAFQSVCQDNHILFIDMTSAFKQLYIEHHILAHGFSNSAVGSGHLNASGHQLIAQSLCTVIVQNLKEDTENDN